MELWTPMGVGAAHCLLDDGTPLPYEVQVSQTPGSGKLIITGDMSVVSECKTGIYE